jgi:hypothetical protein
MAFYDLKAAEEAIAGDNDLYMDRVTKSLKEKWGQAPRPAEPVPISLRN